MSNVKVKFVDLGEHYRRIRDEILPVFDNLSLKGEYIMGEELKKCENNLAQFCETKYVIGVANATDALILCLKAMGIKEGDEVITPPHSFIATAGSISAAGAKPVFVDVKEDYNIDPDKIEKAISFRTKAIMPVHFTGRPADMDKIMAIAKKHNLKVIEDAAQAIGARYKGRKVGSLGDAACFSLHPLKNLHVHGDGGFITTNDEELYSKLMKLRNHGLKNRDYCDDWGYNSRLDNIQAGIVNVKLKYIDQWNRRKQEIAGFYIKELKHYVKVPSEDMGAVYQLFFIRHPLRDKLQAFLLEHGIESKVHYPVLIHLQEPARRLGYKEGDFPVAEGYIKELLSLPVHTELSDEQVKYVVEKIKFFCGLYG